MSVLKSSLAGRLLVAARIAVTAVFALLLFGIPYLTQVERVWHKSLWGWGLYRAHGLGVMDLRYTVVEGETSTPLDRVAALKAPSMYALPMLQRAPHLQQVMPQTNKICGYMRATHGKRATLTLDARVSAWEGWTPVVEDLADVCGAGRPALKRAVDSIRLRRARNPRIPLKRWWNGDDTR